MDNFWNLRYQEEGYAYGNLPNEYLKEKLSSLTPGRILFICEGEGRNAVYAAKSGWHVTAFDLSSEGKRKADDWANQNNVEIFYHIGDAKSISYPQESFDAIACVYAHFPPTVRASIHTKLQNWLKPGGHLIMEAFNPRQLANQSGGPHDLDMLYTSEMMAQDFNSLNILENEEVITHLNEGKYHIGKADVLRFLAQK
jgi:2-polyprenyl-3-methyl-5-hydroxy-6-metoxy-1,4-benzoquinol methylase